MRNVKPRQSQKQYSSAQYMVGKLPLRQGRHARAHPQLIIIEYSAVVTHLIHDTVLYQVYCTVLTALIGPVSSVVSPFPISRP